MHPFRALGKNSELLLVSDEEDMATWQRRSLPLQWAGGLKAQTETEANHTRYMGARAVGCGTSLDFRGQARSRTAPSTVKMPCVTAAHWVYLWEILRVPQKAIRSNE